MFTVTFFAKYKRGAGRDGNKFSPPTPTLAWLWQAGPCAFQTSLGWLGGFAMGYETLRSEATCLAPAVGTLVRRLSGGPSSGLREKS